MRFVLGILELDLANHERATYLITWVYTENSNVVDRIAIHRIDICFLVAVKYTITPKKAESYHLSIY